MHIRKNADQHVPDQEQEQPSRTRRAVLTGGAVGLAAVAGTSLKRSSPAGASERIHPDTTTALVEINASTDNTGVTDTQNIMTAIGALTNGGTIYLGPGDFYVTYVSGYSTTANVAITVPAQTSTGVSGGKGVNIQGCGSATVVHLVSSGTESYTAFYCHRTSNYGAQFGLAAQQTTSFLRDFVVDGTRASATTASVGVDIGDGWWYDINLAIVNFTTSGSVGLNIINRLFWTEKGRFRAQLMNNATAAVLSTTATGDSSHEYNFYDFNIFCNENQQGVVVSGPVNNGGCTLWLHGNMSSTSAASGNPPGNVAALSLLNGSAFYMAEIVMKVEGNGGNGAGAVYPYAIYFDGDTDSFQQCHGVITHSLNQSVINGGEFSFRGFICGDQGLSLLYPGAPGSSETISTQPPLPASGTAQQNYAPDAMVYVTGSNVTSVTVESVNTGVTSGGFFVAAGGIINVAYTGGASTNAAWVWVPAARSPY